MITPEEIVEWTDLTAEEVAAIAEHEHVTGVCAAAMADCLMHREGGPRQIEQMMIADIRAALVAGHRDHARELFGALRHFLAEHPEARRPG